MGAGGGCSPEGCSAETVATVAQWGECMPGHSLPSVHLLQLPPIA